MDARIRILVADDHPMLREGLVAVLGTQPDFEVVGEAADGSEAVRLAETLRPDVILLDLEMPGVDGVAALEGLRDAGSTSRAIVFTAYDTDQRILGALRAGARGYLLKGARHADVAAALHAVVTGQAIFGEGVADLLLSRIGTTGSTRDYPFPLLSEREREVLDLLVAGKRTNEIAAALFVSPKTVSNQLTSVYGKLGVAGRTEAVLLARGQGLPFR